MTGLYKYIFENTSQNKIDKDVAINIIKKLKEEEDNLVDKEDIAITGISLEFPKADNIEMWWDVLKEGVDCVRSFPINRKQDLNKYIGNKKNKFYSGAYLNEIDSFDYSFFSISPKEASLMDPCQRIFLQKAWEVIEDAGYKCEDIYGSRTGVYVGYSSDFGESYKTMVDILEPTVGSLSTTGNIHSIIASRISHILNLKGPSMIIDTACSSSLVAVHLACKAIQNKECNMAIAGGIKLNISPIYKKASLRTGIESSTERTCAFDDSSDGTGLGEGCALIFLKPLKKAIQDRDNIYAIIKGSAINQDGNSMGITAPNAEAQEDVIIRAWKDAKIDPETIDYIEAHGTGTNLGDPIEIEGITRAFRRYTDKKQFCGIGSVKTNIGHLDNASGIASLIKVVISLSKCKIPPSINFNRPNRNIAFQNSPVYVNDILRDWKYSSHPKRCGVSSFGLSGTNCHMILEEAPKLENIHSLNVNTKKNLFKLSAKSYESLNQMLIRYRNLLTENGDMEIEDLCFTANTRRGDYNLRLAIIAEDIENLRLKINKILCFGIKNIKDNEIYFRENNEINNEIVLINKESSLQNIACIYVEGANLKWADFYDGNYNLIKIPTYQFKKSRCWVKTEDITHPLLRGIYSENENEEIYLSLFSAKNQWVVDEHMVYEKNVPPGTAYVEMAYEIGKRHFGNNPFEVKDITFLFPMIFEKDEVKEVRTTVKKSNDCLNFNIESKGDKEDSWNIHATGVLEKLKDVTSLEVIDIEKLKNEYIEKIKYEDNKNYEGHISLGARWKTIKEMYIKEDSILVHLALHEKYYEHSEDYNLHPALLDMAVNVVIREVGNELYLPFSYRSLKLYGKMPNSFYSILKNTNSIKSNMEAVSYSVTMVDENGRVFAKVDNYTIKRVNQSEKKFNKVIETEQFFHKIKWVKREELGTNNNLKKVCILLFENYSERIREINYILQKNECEVIKVKLEKQFKKVSNNEYLVGNSEADFLKLFKAVEKEKRFNTIINGVVLENFLEVEDIETLEFQIDDGIISLLNITKALVNNDFVGQKELVVLSDNAYEIIGTERTLKPLNASVLGFAKVMDQEYKNINVKCVDITEDTKNENIVSEIINFDNYKLVALRGKYRFTEELISIKDDEEVKHELKISSTGAYVITGGTGGIGIEIAKYLSLKNKANICLISRSGFIGKEKWNEVLKSSEDEKLKAKISILKSIEKNGANIEIYKANVSVEKELSEVISSIRNKFQCIKGVFHAAGVAGHGFIMKKEKYKLLNVINPKILGTWLLDKYTNDDKLEMFVLFSSVTSKFGGQGQSDYTAANSFLDAYAVFRNRKNRNTIVINWAPWKETGMAFDHEVLKYEGPLKSISTVDAIDILDKIITKELDNVIIGQLNKRFLLNNIKNLPFELEVLIKNEIQIDSIKDKENNSSSDEKKSIFHVVLTGKDDDYSENEKLVSRITGNVIGMRKVNVHETFKNMGIDSIISSIIVRNIDEILPNVVSIADFYTYSTIAQLAAYIDKKVKNTIGAVANYKEKNQELKGLLKALKSDGVSGDEILEFLNEFGGINNE